MFLLILFYNIFIMLEINYNTQELIDLIKQSNISIVIGLIADKIKDNFPYKKYYLDDQEILNKFNNLSNYEPYLVNANYNIYNIKFKNKELDKLLYFSRNSQVILEKKYSDYENYNIISDYFQEECRLSCSRSSTTSSSLSPLEYYKKNLYLIVSD